MAYSNQRYSYDEEEVFSCDSWTRYDKEYLEKLKADYELEKLVANCGNDFERVQAVTEWVTNLWAHNGDNIPEQNDPLSILHNVTEEGSNTGVWSMGLSSPAASMHWEYPRVPSA